jgi:uncharacterized membrane protein YphA (DoxX/SURF4 family)
MTIGTRVYGLGAIALGAVGLVFPTFAVGQELPPNIPFHDVLIYASAAILILGGLALNLPRLAAAGAGVLAGYLTFWAVVLNGPHLVAHPLEFVSYESIGEIVALAAGGVVAYGLASGGQRSATLARGGRLVFGLCLLIFGGAHFAYARYTATFVPAWLPPSQMFWTYATGVAQIAAGLAVLSGIQARLATVLLTVMYAIFGLLVHVPHLLAEPHKAGHWAEFCVNLALMGAAWVVADSIGRKTRA